MCCARVPLNLFISFTCNRVGERARVCVCGCRDQLGRKIPLIGSLISCSCAAPLLLLLLLLLRPEFAKEIPFLQISEISWQFSEITLDCLSFPGHERHFVSP